MECLWSDGQAGAIGPPVTGLVLGLGAERRCWDKAKASARTSVKSARRAAGC